MENKTPVIPVDFTRWQWAGLVERNYWAPIFREVSTAFHELERLAVVKGLRKAAWQFVAFDSLVTSTEWAHKHGLLLIPTNLSASTTGYASTGAQLSGRPTSVRCVYVRPEHYTDVLPFTENQKIGEWLGFPKCCRDNFDNTWAVGSVDTTFEQVKTDNFLWETSTLFRWMGVRLVAHLPCHYGCEESQRIGQQFYELGLKSGFLEQMMYAKEILHWPVYGSRLIGISELITPALKIISRTNWTPTKEEFTISGIYNRPTKFIWKDNGFKSFEGMRRAHAALIDQLKEQLPPNARVLDLGCGDGHLLRRLQLYRPDVRIAGVDHNEDAIIRAKKHMVGTWWAGKIQDGQWKDWGATAALINPARFLEMSEEEAKKTKHHLRHVPMLFVYNYDDKDINTLSEEAGLRVEPLFKVPNITMGVQHTHADAGMWENFVHEDGSAVQLGHV